MERYLQNTATRIINGSYVIEPQWEYADDFVDAGGQWVAAVYKYSESEVIWKGFINEANELIGEISY